MYKCVCIKATLIVIIPDPTTDGEPQDGEARSLLSEGGSLRPLFGALRRRAKKLSPEKRMMRGSDLT
ncbi:hypothetical protein CEXT_729471 [Caerostris extrusa]|uniref:Uncharacterized protein n=1 Tax=Caerostris extrusa TaxID=172846 RepID=A0AAV4WAK5_CAEEX|nr:hypothetical protein CEXT_729471 [Caerostris extrusa]